MAVKNKQNVSINQTRSEYSARTIMGSTTLLTCALSKLHDDVKNSRPTTGILSLNGINISYENVAIKFLLHSTHACEEYGLMFRGQRFLHVCFQSPEHKGPQDFVKLRNKLVLFVVVVNVQIEPLIKLFSICKYIRNQKIQQCPQFVKRIL